MPIYYSGSSGSTTKDFHAIRRTKDGLLYYTQLKSSDPDTIETQKYPDPTNPPLPVEEYVEEETSVQPETYTFTGSGSATDFTLPVEVLTQNTYVWLNGVLQERDRDYFFEGAVCKFRVPPFDQAQIAIRFAAKQYFNNDNDKYQQYRVEQGQVFYYVDSEGYFVKRFGGFDRTTVLSGAGADAYESYVDASLVNITSYKEDISTGFDQTNLSMDDTDITMDAT